MSQPYSQSTFSYNTCAHCGREFDPTVEQAYELEGEIVCPTCVAAADVEHQSAPSDELAALAGARAGRRSSVRSRAARSRGPVKKKSSAGSLIAAALGLLCVVGISGWLYSSGMLEKWMRDTKGDVTGVTADNERVARYNALLNAGTEQAKARQYAQAAATLKEARKILEDNPRLSQLDVNAAKAELTATIARYESMSQGKAATPAPGTVSTSRDE